MLQLQFRKLKEMMGKLCNPVGSEGGHFFTPLFSLLAFTGFLLICLVNICILCCYSGIVFMTIGFIGGMMICILRRRALKRPTLKNLKNISMPEEYSISKPETISTGNAKNKDAVYTVNATNKDADHTVNVRSKTETLSKTNEPREAGTLSETNALSTAETLFVKSHNVNVLTYNMVEPTEIVVSRGQFVEPAKRMVVPNEQVMAPTLERITQGERIVVPKEHLVESTEGKVLQNEHVVVTIEIMGNESVFENVKNCSH
ncbi:unnamed protein product [Owenia fusiformis]|uniref:Uncharacterized protein n=1 Tax=Owenia fusiformis TaxID=6347 RepID=A0A8J1Y908_OWEFU|nr:unnamed protein product [Owenia fusiformis]